ncbi:MAG: glycosyltransferase family 9 protein [Pseudomonadota bacterium]
MTVLVLPEPGLWRTGLPAPLLARGSAVVLCPESDRQAVEGLPGQPLVVTFEGGSLTPSRPDLAALAARLDLSGEVVLVRDETLPRGWDAYVCALGLMGAKALRLLGQSGETPVTPPGRPDMVAVRSLLLVACSGIGNVVQTTPLLVAARRHGLDVAFCPVSDAGSSLALLFRTALPGLTVLTPEQAHGFEADLRLNIECRALLRPGDFFHSPYRDPVTRHEADAYAQFFANVTGLSASPDESAIGGHEAEPDVALRGRVVLCPGSKPGWDPKRWPHFGALVRRLENPVVLCRQQDLDAYATLDFLAPIQGGRATVITEASLPEAAAILRHAAAVVANDCGLAHMAAATGAPTLVLFGPSSLDKNRPLGATVRSLSLCLDCQPCQLATSGPGRLAPGDSRCDLGYPCLADMTVDMVLDELQRCMETVKTPVSSSIPPIISEGTHDA